MSLAGIAKETLAIIERGAYVAPSGAQVVVRESIDAAIAGTILYAPEALDDLRSTAPGTAPPQIEVTAETTGEAGRRLVQTEQVPHVVALNFASARRPGGGFLGGARAQEEDLARCSALYPCLREQRGYYDANRSSPSFLYTDHIINDPAQVAQAFAGALDRFIGSFDRVVFAIHDPGGYNMRAFEHQFGPAAL